MEGVLIILGFPLVWRRSFRRGTRGVYAQHHTFPFGSTTVLGVYHTMLCTPDLGYNFPATNTSQTGILCCHGFVVCLRVYGCTVWQGRFVDGRCGSDLETGRMVATDGVAIVYLDKMSLTYYGSSGGVWQHIRRRIAAEDTNTCEMNFRLGLVQGLVSSIRKGLTSKQV